ncbi:hypothetical protein P4114_31760 [Pseudomonas aeruginosa]|nr:hypothetical protein [Pseudomonas aeruginosa]
MMVFLLCIVAYRMVPSLARLSDPVTWTGPLATLNAIASFVTGPGIVLVAVITLTVVVIVTLPTYRWKGRVWLDRTLPPWSIYRMLEGTTFPAEHGGHAQRRHTPLRQPGRMIKISRPGRSSAWKPPAGVGLGENLGVALRSAGHVCGEADGPSSTCASWPTGEASPKRWSSSAAAGRRPASSGSSWPPGW